MIKYNLNTINDWNFGDDNIIKVYRNNAVCYYKVTSGDTPTPVQEPCFAVVDDISQYSDTEFEDVFNNADGKWYKLNNLSQYEEYGIYGSGRTITTYEGKLTIDEVTIPSPSRLPSGYTEVEYIESNGTQYINTNAYITNTANFEVGYTISGKTHQWGYVHQNVANGAWVAVEENRAYFGRWNSSYWVDISNQITTGNNTIVYKSNSGITVNETFNAKTLSLTSTDNITTIPLHIFGWWDFYKGGVEMQQITQRYKSFYLKVNGVLIRDLVPCKRDSDNKYGMYDLVSDTFYLSPNGNDFSGGSEVTPPPITKTYEYIYSGASWVNVGEVSGSSKTSDFTIGDINDNVTIKSSIADGDYYVISYYNHNNPKEPRYMMSYTESNNYLNNFSGHTGSNSITPSTIIDAAIWKFEATSSANTYYIKNIHNNLYWGYQTRVSTRSLNLVGESDSSKAIVKVGVANSSTTVGFLELNVNGSSYTYEDGTVGGYALNQLNGYTYRMNWWNTGGWGSDGNSAYYLYKINANNAEYPMYYDEKSDPPNNLSFSSMTEAESYECPWVGMTATIDGDNYVFSGDSQSGYEWVYKPSRLPQGYTEVEYVENQDMACINTEFKPNQDTRIIAEMQTVASTSYVNHFGAGSWNEPNALILDYENGYNGTLHLTWGTATGWTVVSSVIGDYSKHTYDWNKNEVYRDNTLVKSFTYGNYQAVSNLYIFSTLNNGSSTPPSSQVYYMKGKLYSLKIYDNGTLVRDFIPCIRDNDNKVGVYDIVNNQFYSSASGYELVAGNLV